MLATGILHLHVLGSLWQWLQHTVCACLLPDQGQSLSTGAPSSVACIGCWRDCLPAPDLQFKTDAAPGNTLEGVMAKQIKWVTPDTRLDSLNSVFDRISGVPVVKSNADMTLVSSTATPLGDVRSAKACLSASNEPCCQGVQYEQQTVGSRNAATAEGARPVSSTASGVCLSAQLLLWQQCALLLQGRATGCLPT